MAVWWFPTISKQEKLSKSLCILCYEYSLCSLLYFHRDLVESGADLFEGVISEMFQLADQGQKGYVSKDEFTTVCWE